MSDKIKLLIIDDDETIVQSLSVSLTSQFPDFELFASSNGQSALELMKKKFPDIVISDINMPEMNGFELIQTIRADESLKDTYFILFTGFSELDVLKNVFESGADDYFTKPFKSTELNARLKAAIRIVELQRNLKKDNLRLQHLADMLAKDLDDMKKIACKLVQARVPALFSMFEKIAFASSWIAKAQRKLNEEQIKDLELTAYLCYVGKLFLPDNLIRQPVMKEGLVTDDLMYQVPHKGKEILNTVTKLKGSADLIYAMYENFDGTGIPEKLKSWQIPIGSRIVRLVLDFYELIFVAEKSINESYQIILKQSNRIYDSKLVILLEQYIAVAERTDEEYKSRSIKEFELLPGMELACDITTLTGFKLLTAGTVLNENQIKKIITHSTTDPIIGCVIIKLV